MCDLLASKDMPIFFYWGSDDFRLSQAVTNLRDRTLDPQWASFNYDKIPPEQTDGPVQALNQAMTPPFGLGKRFIWLQDTPLGQRCPEYLLAELQRTLPVIPETSILLLTSPNKPDGRLKSTKLLQKYTDIQEFSPIPPWKTELLAQQVRRMAGEARVNLAEAAVELLAESVGADTRRLANELEKLRLYSGDRDQPLAPESVSDLVLANTQNSLQLAAALRQGDTVQALSLATDLINRNEPGLRIVSTLTGQFRTWLWVKVMLETGERNDKAIAQAAEVNNPKRIYFLQKEVRALTLEQLQQTLPLLMELEAMLKRGADELTTLQTKAIEISQLFH